MLQVQGPMQSHVATTGMPGQSYDAFVQEHLEGLCQTHKDENLQETTYFDENPLKSNDNENASPMESSEYVIMAKKEENQSPDPLKSATGGENRTSVFDDSDYDEVIDFLTSSTLDSTSDTKAEPNDKSTSDVVSNVENDPSSSKRSSASSSVSHASSMTSGVESGGEQSSNPKYAELDLAKILHTRRRMHRILQSPLEGGTEKESRENENQVTTSSSAKKKSYMSKRNTHYGTIGGTRSKSSSSMPRNSRPPSAGDEIFASSISSSNFFTPDPSRNKLDVSNSFYSLKRIPKSDQSCKKSSTSDEEERAAAEQENRRWSRISSSSQNSDKVVLSPHKGPWKAFRKFVNNSNSASTRNLSHDEIKATIHLQHSNSSNNNNRVTRSLSRDFLHAADSSKASVSSCEDPNASADAHSGDVPRRHTNSLLRRFSRKSRSKSARRKSLPVNNVLGVNPPDSNEGVSSSQTVQPPPSGGQSGNSSQIENMVLSSLQSRQVEEEKRTPEKPKKSNSIRRRLMSFSRKRSSSQERKTILKENCSEASENEDGQMNKALSYSSPQLSIFAVNSKSKQTANKLVF